MLLKALEKDVNKRYASANEFLKALDQLPAELRASSDEDVADYVRSLVGPELEERRAHLQVALERRNQGMPAPVVPLPSAENSSRASMSSIGSFSVVGTAASLRPGQNEGDQAAVQARRRNRTIMAGAVLALIAVAGAATVLLLKPDPKSEEASPVPPHTAPSLGAPGGSVPLVEGPAPTAELPAPSVLTPAGSAEVIELPDEPVAEKTVTTRRPVVRKEVKEPTAAPKPSAKPKTWRQDPGF